MLSDIISYVIRLAQCYVCAPHKQETISYCRITEQSLYTVYPRAYSKRAVHPICAVQDAIFAVQNEKLCSPKTQSCAVFQEYLITSLRSSLLNRPPMTRQVRCAVTENKLRE